MDSIISILCHDGRAAGEREENFPRESGDLALPGVFQAD